MHSASDPWRLPLRSRETWFVVVLFTAVTVLLAYPLSLNPASLRFPTGPDGDLGWYLLGWDSHAFLHRPWGIFDANIYHPKRLTLAYGENVIGLAFFAAPIIWLTGNLLLAANLVSMATCVLCGLGAYVLARRLGLSLAAAVLAGIIFEAAPPRFFRIGQITLSAVQWIPFALASLHAYFEHGHKRDLRLTAGFVSLQALSSGYGMVFLAVSLAALSLYRVALGEALRLAKRVRDLGVAGAMLLLPAVLVFLPYLFVQSDAGMRRGLGGNWLPNYDSFFASPSHVHRYLISLVGATDLLAEAGSYLFPGYLAVALAAAAIVWRRRDPSAVRDAPWWRQLPLLVQAGLFGTSATAAVMTVATLIPLRAGTAQLVDRRSAAGAWILCTGLALVGVAIRHRVPADTVRRLRRPLFVLLVTALTWALLGAVRPAVDAGQGLVGEYFTNPDWAGLPAFSAVDSELSPARMRQRWNLSPPDQFSVRWIGFLTVGRSGVYTFATTSDDASQLFYNNEVTPVVDNGGVHGPGTRSGRIHLDRGAHMVELRYAQYGGGAALDWSWSRDGKSYSTVPAWALSERPTTYGTMIAARVVDWALPILAILTVLATTWYARAWLSGGPGQAIAAWAGARRRDAATFYVLLTLFTFGLALGPPHGLWQYFYWMPVFNFIRAHSRFTLVTLLGLAVLAAFGFDAITRRWTRRARSILAAAVGVLLIVEYAAMPMAVGQGHLDIPAVDRWLDSQRKPFVVAEVPVNGEQDQVSYMIHSTAHWQKTVHGFHGWRHLLHTMLYWDMQKFPDEKGLGQLSDLGVTYIVVHTERYPPGEWPGVEERLRQYSARLRLVHAEGAGRVYLLVSSRAGNAGSGGLRN
jgi:hypothetical protein